MFIAIPHQRNPHFGHECRNGTRDCQADCEGCREMRDSHAVVGDWDTPERELIRLAIAYQGHQKFDVWLLICDEWSQTEILQAIFQNVVGEHYTSDKARAAIASVDWQDHYPAADGDGRLTGDVLDADRLAGYAIVDDCVAVRS